MDWTRIGHSVERLLANQPGLSVDFVWRGKSYWGCRSTLRKEIVNTDGGLAGDYSFSLLCPASEFELGRPQPRTDKIVIGKVEYRVLAVEADAVGSTVKLHLGDALA